MLDAQDAAGQGVVPMAHQFQVGAVVARDVVDAVGEFLALGEQLLEVAETAGHRLTPGIDDLRIGQHQVDQPDMAEIVGHLVDEVGLARPVDPRLVEISLSQVAQGRFIEIGQDRWIARMGIVAVRALQLQGDALDVRQFVRTFDLAVRGQDLLDQGRAGARQAQDEDRIGGGRPPAAARFEKGAAGGLDLLRRIGLDGLNVEMAVRTLQGVAAFVEGPGLGEIAAILVSLAERETQVIAVDEMRRCRRFLAPHDVHFRVGKGIGFQVGQAPIGVAEVRPGLRRAAVGDDRFRHAADGFQRVPQPQRHVP